MKHLSPLSLVFLSLMLFSNVSEARTLLVSPITAIEKVKEVNDPLIIIDGKVASKKDLDELDTNVIASVTVLKSKQASNRKIW